MEFYEIEPEEEEEEAVQVRRMHDDEFMILCDEWAVANLYKKDGKWILRTHMHLSGQEFHVVGRNRQIVVERS